MKDYKQIEFEVVNLLRSIGINNIALDVPISMGNRKTRMDVVGYYDESLKLPLAIIEIVDNVNDSLGILDSSVQRAYANAQVLGDDVRYVAISDGNKIRWFERTISSKSLKEIEFAPQLHDLNTSKLNSEFTALVDEDQLFDLIGDILNLYKESGIKPNIEALTDINKIILAKKFDEELYEYTDVGRLYQGQNLDISVRQINIIISKISDVNGVDLKELNLNGSKFAIISQVVKLLSKFSLSRLPSAAFENVLWDIYFPILKFDQLSYFTPKSLIDLMVSFANPKGSEAIYDPACGSGALLISAAKYSEIARRGTPPLFGVDIDDSVVEFAVTNLLMSGLKVNQLKRSNSIDQQSKIVPVSYDLILLDPPLGRMSNQGDSNKGLEIDFPESDYLEVNLISIAIMRLKNQGRGIFLIPDNLLKAPRFSIFRSWLLDRVKIDAIIKLPDAAFSDVGHSGKASLMVVTKSSSINTRGTCLIGVINSSINGEILENSEIKQLINIFRNLPLYSDSDISKMISSKIVMTTIVNSSDLDSNRLDPSFLINKLKNTTFDLKNSVYPLQKLGELVDIIGGRDLKWDKSDNPLDPIVIPAGAVREFRIDELKTYNISMNQFNKNQRTQIISGDVLVTTTGQYLGRAAVFDSKLAIATSSVAILRPSAGMDPYYLAFIFNSDIIKQQLSDLAESRSVIPFLTLRSLQNIQIPLPVISQQREISAQLKHSIDSANSLRNIADSIESETINSINRRIFKEQDE